MFDEVVGRDVMTLSVVGLIGGEWFGAAAGQAIADSDVVVGSPRQLLLVGGALTPTQECVPLTGPLGAVFDRIAADIDGDRDVCVLASGDPGFFGIVRALTERFVPACVTVHPAPSSVAMAFARVGLSWDDARIVSAHGRALDAAVDELMEPVKAAVLASPENPPQAVGAALVGRGIGPREVHVISRIGEAGESCTCTDVGGLATGTFDAMSVVILCAPTMSAIGPTLAWGLAESRFAHRSGMITKAEVRAISLGKLDLPATGVLWDVGAGSGSVGIEAARLRPGLRVIAVEKGSDDCERIRANADAHGVSVEVVEGLAPDAFAMLPSPDRVFIGGGGIGVLDVALARLRPGGTVVANYTILGRAAEAWERLGNLVEIGVSRGVAVPSAGVRMVSENPVFVTWGPTG